MEGFYFLVIVTVLLILNTDTSVNAEFPDDPKPCKYEDSECIMKVANYLMHDKITGDNSFNLVKLDPLPIAKVDLKQGEESPVNIDMTLTNSLVYGLKDTRITKVKGFGKDFTQKQEIQFNMNTVSMVGDYKVKGKILILPITGTGKSNISLVNPVVKMKFSGTPKELNGETYMTINNMKIDVIPERIIFDLTNLFNGDKALGDNMNIFLNENWKEIYNEVKTPLLAVFAEIFQSVINKVFEKYPYKKYFAKE